MGSDGEGGSWGTVAVVVVVEVIGYVEWKWMRERNGGRVKRTIEHEDLFKY